MANSTHYSSGGGDFRVDVNITDFTEEITEGIKEAIQRALVRIGWNARVTPKCCEMWSPGGCKTASQTMWRATLHTSEQMLSMRNLKRRAQADGPRTRICAQQPRGIWTNGSESWKANLKTAANLPELHMPSPTPWRLSAAGFSFGQRTHQYSKKHTKKRTIKLKMCIKA